MIGGVMSKRFRVRAWLNMEDDDPIVDRRVSASDHVAAARCVLFGDRLGWCDWVRVDGLDVPHQTVKFLDARASSRSLELALSCSSGLY
jgi:hypothetical protein